jgi:hypothetical protein
MNTEDTIRAEIDHLRQDLRDLKRCQVQYFAFSVTSTGAILGLAASLPSPYMRGLSMLAPLVILLPCWVIFFDKATTITRIVGYQRVLEHLLIDPVPPKYRYIGFENALAEFRAAEAARPSSPRASIPPRQDSDPIKPSLWGMIFLRARHRYWMVNWYTFAALSLLSCLVSYSFLTESPFVLNAPLGIRFEAPERTLWAGTGFILVLAFMAYTFRMVYRLTRGTYSYDETTVTWQRILALHPPIPPVQGDTHSGRV